jgi:hypothetical protein
MTSMDDSRWLDTGAGPGYEQQSATIRHCGRDWPADPTAEQPVPADAEITFTSTWTWSALVAEFGEAEATAILADRLLGKQTSGR